MVSSSTRMLHSLNQNNGCGLFVLYLSNGIFYVSVAYRGARPRRPGYIPTAGVKLRYVSRITAGQPGVHRRLDPAGRNGKKVANGL